MHDESKDKDFELEMSWICPASDYQHKAIPKDVLAEAGAKAKEILDAENEMEE